MMWVLAVAVFLLSCGWTAACPVDCSCRHEQGLYAANCSSLPYIGGKIEALTLLPTSDNPLELTDGQFISARHLKYLSLRNSSIYYVHKKALYGAKNIVEIDLSFNYIEEFESTVFQHLTSLTTLVLRGNPVRFVSEVPFLISNSLQNLDIGQCKLTSIPRGIFYGLKRLKYLSMDGNFLKSLEYNSIPKGLKYLNLSNNLIVNVQTEVISALTNLRRIGLSGNPINCSCSLMDLQDWLSGRGVIFEDDVSCSIPSEYYGVSWSKVDENSLCLAEARREEMSHSTNYNPLFKNRLYRGNYFENENSYLGENVQSDQPHILPDSQAEVLFKNDETVAMGEMMRDEEDTKALNNEEHFNTHKDDTIDADVESATISKTPEKEEAIEAKTMEPEDVNVNLESIKAEDVETELKNDETILSMDKETDNVLENSNLEVSDLNKQDSESHGDNFHENKAIEEDGYADSSKQTYDNSVDIVETVSDLTNSTLKKLNIKEEEHDAGDIESEGSGDGLDLSHSVNLNGSIPVEYKQLNEDELDDFKKEGLYVEDNEYNLETNNTSEETTIAPEIEEYKTEDEFSTEIAPTLEGKNEVNETGDLNITSSTESNNGTIFDEGEAEEDEQEIKITEPPTIFPDVPNINVTEENGSVNIISNNDEEPSSTDDDLLSVPVSTTDQKVDKIKEVVGAEVVMFCIAVLIICLILYSVYKCRNSNKRQSMRTVKDVESNRGTEMQDMASLLPKPQNDDKKNNLKYPDKAPSSETVKLITEQNENEPNFTPVADTNNKVEDKNALNNNTPSSPSSKTPLIKPSNPVTINPAAPIQRTKVKVGILPDSIPRTPIFLQKSYNNGTKHV